MFGQVIWITGLSGAGKTTLAKALVRELHKQGQNPILLDGEALRKIFNLNVQQQNEFDRNARIKIALTYAQICQLLSSQGFTVVIATISMFKEIYIWNQKNLPKYFEVYLKVPIQELKRRDPKHFYQRYDEGKLINFPGLDIIVDEPKNSNTVLDFEHQPTVWKTPESLLKCLMLDLQKNKIV